MLYNFGLADLGWNDVSFHGSNQIPTPTIDDLAHSGVILDRHYVNAVCSPTRSSLMTGRAIINTGIYDPLATGVNSGLNASCNRPTEQPCLFLPEVLNGMGYRSYMVGKWHLGMYSYDQVPTQRGFAEWRLGYLGGAEDYFKHISGPGLDFWRANATAFNAATNESGQYSTTLFANQAVEVIEEHKATRPADEPFFLYLAWQAMHSPLEAPQEAIDKFNSTIEDISRRTVAAMVTEADDGIARVRDALKRAGHGGDDTIIVFSADNGESAFKPGVRGNGCVAAYLHQLARCSFVLLPVLILQPYRRWSRRWFQREYGVQLASRWA